jgi:hypothetical protein
MLYPTFFSPIRLPSVHVGPSGPVATDGMYINSILKFPQSLLLRLCAFLSSFFLLIALRLGSTKCETKPTGRSYVFSSRLSQGLSAIVFLIQKVK